MRIIYIFANAGSADAALPECPNAPSLFIAKLSRVACEISRSVVIERYSSQKPASPFANEFDKREVAIASGKKLESVMAVAGIRIGQHDLQPQKNFLRLPFVEQIAKLHSRSKPKRYGHWIVTYQKVEYGVQGSFQGFALECATATYSTAQAAKIVAECFPFGERARFFVTLDAVR